MLIKELVVTLKNMPGQLYKVVSALSDQGIDLKAVTCTMYGKDKTKVKLISMNLDDAKLVLRDRKIEFVENEVIIIDVEDKPGELARVLKLLSEAEINIEYVYTTLTYLPCRVLAVFDFTDPGKALEVLKKNQITVVTDHTVLKSSCDGNIYVERDIREYLTTVITP
ncbi:MAG: ACT domain-containing protein [Candidatus Wallbacteria bacterium]|nr:ACT domain-containing protein [Candidatus Wallbacteria bacterium]